MNKKLLTELKEKLEKERSLIEEELKRFAKKDPKIKGDWDTRYPDFDGSSAGGEKMEDEAAEVERYSTLLPIEYSLEKKLQDVSLALKKIRKGIYGKCEKCGKRISEERLRIFPTAKLCKRCQQ